MRVTASDHARRLQKLNSSSSTFKRFLELALVNCDIKDGNSTKLMGIGNLLIVRFKYKTLEN
jgi:hypothetical protein